ncbi:MAG: helix-turn-helix transcriptional regulator, partial [Candidatus Eremiobacteraeota bacterium]|nr:helix-turn-helix transcriptional regulator [Candidatus Eremiobacteraeota bacterium]
IALEGLALELVAQLALRGAGRTEPAPRWIGAAREMIAAQYDAVTPGAIARAFDLDASYVARAFRMHVGRTLGDEIRAVRIARAARRFVAEPAAVLAEVAAEAGFFDQSHFSRVFKRVVGVTPRHYRELDRATRSALARSKPS